MESLKGRKHREFSVEFKEVAAQRLLAGASGTALSRELGVRRSVLYRWRDAYRAEGIGGLSRKRGRPAAQRWGALQSVLSFLFRFLFSLKDHT